MEKLKLHSPDLTQENIAKLAEIFPNCVTESKSEDGAVKRAIDFDQLHQELSTAIVEGPQERYQLNWPGKREALLTANAPIAKTLRPCREESVNFDTTQNLFIEGDNLDALKLLRETYLNKVKMIYIDPPYNTGKDFIYEDDFAEKTEEFLTRSNQKNAEGGRLVANTEANGRFHSDWLSMMYPRLKLARNLLRDDGIVFISIDDNEVNGIRYVLDEIFGRDNFIGQMVWKKKYIGGKHAKHLVDLHEYILVYAKNTWFLPEILMDRPEKEVGKFELQDEYLEERGRFYIRPLKSNLGRRDTLIYPIELPDGNSIETQWMVAEDTFFELVKNGRIVFKEKKDGTFNVYRKYYQYDGDGKVKVPTLIEDVSNADGKVDIKILFDVKEGREIPFDNPKPVGLLRHLLEPTTNGEDIILDFFSGSATTAHAVMALNVKDSCRRKFIMVQLPEFCDEKSEAYKAGYKTIAEIGKERIRRAGKKIKAENTLTAPDLDIGFRVLKVDSSNMKDVYYAPDAVKQVDLPGQVNNIREERTPEDLLFQVLLDWGVDLTLPITQEAINGKQVFFVDGDALAACFESGINEEFVKTLAARHPLRAVFRDAGFGSDSVKINIEQIFKLISPTTEVKSI
ncbi:MAG: site-specific DNA-methyltransferase [Sulfuricellaceae bacterium]